MKTYGLQNVAVETVSSLPTTDLIAGRLVLLVNVDAGLPGLYAYTGTEWVSGDITTVHAGPGLTGGGSVGGRYNFG